MTEWIMDQETKEKMYKEHKEKYRALNKKHGVACNEDSLPKGWTKEALRAKIMEDREENQSLNFIPLRWWDARANMMRAWLGARLSLGEAVCMQKQECLDYLFEGEK